MDPTPDRPEPSHLLNDLDPILRQAVEQVRSQPIPPAVQETTLEKVRTMSQPLPRPGWRPSPLVLLASMAATLFLGFGVGLWAGVAKWIPGLESPASSHKVALLKEADKPGLPAPDEPSHPDIGRPEPKPTNYNVDRVEPATVTGLPAPVNNPPPVATPTIPASAIAPSPGPSGANPTRDGRKSDYEQFKEKPQQGVYRPAMEMQKKLKETSDEAPRARVKQAEQAKGAAGDFPQQAGEWEGGEDYRHFMDNPFQAPLLYPLSTFSISVDTASYSNVRRFLTQENRLPPPDAVRVAELINYFPYEYAQPTDEHPVAFTTQISECPWNTKHHLVRIGMKGKQLDPAQMPPRNFVFLCDTSGSMSPENRLPLLRKSLKVLVQQMTPRDRVALVAYSGSAGLVLDSTPGNEKDKINAAIDRLHSGGSTNGGAGIELAYKVAIDNFMKDGVNRVILGTDGDFNVGTTSQADLIRLIEEKRKTGVYLTLLGFGMGNLKDGTLERLAHHGKGHYAYLDSEEEAKKVFVEQGASLVTIAKDVKLQVEFNPQVVSAYRLIGYENRLLRAEDFNDDTKHAGDIGTGHTVTALYEIVPATLNVPKNEVDALKYSRPIVPTDAAFTGEWLTVKLRYKDPDADTSKLLLKPLAGAPAKFDKMPEDFRFAAAVAAYGQLLRDSEYKGEITWAGARELASDALGTDPNGHRKAFLELVKVAEKLANPAKPPMP